MAYGFKSGGRRKGTRNSRPPGLARAMKVAAQKLEAALGSNAFSGDAHALLIMVYKDPAQPLPFRLDAAKAAIGYEQPKLASLQAKIDGQLAVYQAVEIPVDERDPLPERAN